MASSRLTYDPSCAALPWRVDARDGYRRGVAVSDDPPKRRWFARSPNRSIILDAGDIKLRVGHGTQRRVLGLLVGPIIKFAVGAVVAMAAGVAAWRC